MSVMTLHSYLREYLSQLVVDQLALCEVRARIGSQASHVHNWRLVLVWFWYEDRGNLTATDAY